MQNDLQNETSPYLLQHASNPVAWHPWNALTLAKARQENKPILLSIGYAACHWCHVMAHESFEDAETAAMMNELFINIKVDREERPDLDKIYQTTHLLLTEHGGGWPLTVFLTPDDCAPFFSGTYFPKVARPPLPAFKDVLQKIASIYRDRHDDVIKQNESLKQALQHTYQPPAQPVKLTNAPIALGQTLLEEIYDAKNGGFGTAPKFPQPGKLALLIAEKSPIALHTLLQMAEGGIYDQLRGGFYRYSVDAQWQIPHFEKMLYDNALLIGLYAKASQVYDEPYFAQIARETADWVMTEMQAPAGGYYATLDADTEGHEGKFYVWDKAEIEKILTREEFAMARVYYGLDDPANFEGQWHLHIAEALRDQQEKEKLASAKQKLLQARQKRVHPHRDEKILTAWNGLMINAMLIAGHILKDKEITASANQALQFIQEKLWRDQRLFACFHKNKASISAYLDDYVFLLQAVITSIEINNDSKNLDFARELGDSLLTHFYDSSAGGFFFTADDHEKLLYQPKTFMDEALPAGNAIAVLVLLELGRIINDPRYFEAAEATLKLAWPALSQYPAEHCFMLLGLNVFLQK